MPGPAEVLQQESILRPALRSGGSTLASSAAPHDRCGCVNKIFSEDLELIIARGCARVPPGSTIAAIAAVQATIERFAGTATGTMVTLSGCMEDRTYEDEASA